MHTASVQCLHNTVVEPWRFIFLPIMLVYMRALCVHIESVHMCTLYRYDVHSAQKYIKAEKSDL